MPIVLVSKTLSILRLYLIAGSKLYQKVVNLRCIIREGNTHKGGHGYIFFKEFRFIGYCKLCVIAQNIGYFHLHPPMGIYHMQLISEGIPSDHLFWAVN